MEGIIMGFRPEKTIYTMHFQGTFLDGLIVKVGCPTVAEFNEMLRWQAASNSDVADVNDKSTQRFLDYLIDWNLENPIDGPLKEVEVDRDGEIVMEWQTIPDIREGEPTPHTLEGCGVHEQIVIREIMQQWQKAIAGVSEELGKGSMNGSDSLERSLGMGG
jgi:hypothetical protein